MLSSELDGTHRKRGLPGEPSGHSMAWTELDGTYYRHELEGDTPMVPQRHSLGIMTVESR